MSPTCSSRFLVGRKTRSAAALTTTEFLPRGNYPRSPENTYAGEAYAMRIGSARGNRWGTQPARQCGSRWYVRPALRGWRLTGSVPACGRGMRRRGAPGRKRAGGQLPGRGRVGASSPRTRSSRRASKLEVTVRNAGERDDPEHRHDGGRVRPSHERRRRGGRQPSRLRPERRPGRDRRLPGGKGRGPARLRHRLREHLGVRAAQAERAEDVPLVGHGRARRRLQNRVARWRPASTARRRRSRQAAARLHAAASPGSISDEAPQVRVADDGKTVVDGTR